MNVAQLIINNILNSNARKISGKIKEKFYLNLRDVFLKRSTKLIEYSLDGRKIMLPVLHDLPINRKIFPFYSENIGRIASYLFEKYNDLKVIDIGANAGDTVYIVKSKVDVPVLCIEGDDYFFSILKKNAAQWTDVFIERTFIGDKEELKGGYSYYKGTGRIIENENQNQTIRFEKLQTVIQRNPLFENSRLLKIDTDGFDCRILRSSFDYLVKSKPVIFFEYDPYLLQQSNDDGLSLFSAIQDIGYDTAIFYDNSGDYILSLSLKEKKIIEDIHNYYSGRNAERYCDVCLFHKEDDDIANIIREKELRFFYVKRKNNDSA